MSTSLPPVTGNGRVGDVIRVASGNMLEMYDFMVFGYFADVIGRTYFGSGDEWGSLLKALATFGAGFLMRPLGAIVLGAYTDRHGRRAGLLLTLLLMGVGILLIAVTPGYATIGIAAPVAVLFGRLIQGLSAGAELGSVSVYLSEIAPAEHKGFYVAWQSASQQVAVMLAAGIGLALAETLSPQQIESWGWRIPLLVGCLLIPLLVLLRGSLRETAEFEGRTGAPSVRETLLGVWQARGTIAIGVSLVLMTTISFYLITAYTPTFGKLLNLSPRTNLLVTGCVGLSNLIWLPLIGALSDRIGRRPIMLTCAGLALLTAYPTMHYLAAAPSLARLMGVELWLSALYAGYNAAMVVFLTEIVPPKVRASGFSLAYSLATALGGFTPFIATWLIKRFDDPAMPGLWLTAAAGVSLAATLATMITGYADPAARRRKPAIAAPR